MKALLIINPISGKTKRKLPPVFQWTFKKLAKNIAEIPQARTTVKEIMREVRARCRKDNVHLDIRFTKYAGHATKLASAAKNKYGRIISAGGDGTVNEIVNGMVNSKATLVIIPFGSTNVLAMDLGLTFDVKKAAALITHGKKIKMDLGYAETKEGGRYFAMMLGIGFVPSLIKRVGKKFKKFFGKFAYPIMGIRNLFLYKWYRIFVKHKTTSWGYFVLVANIRNYGGEYEIADKASKTDGLLDLVVINRSKWWDVVKFLFQVFGGKTNTFLRGEYFQIKNAEIYSRHKMYIQADGELIGTAPVKVKVVPQALNIMVNK